MALPGIYGEIEEVVGRTVALEVERLYGGGKATVDELQEVFGRAVALEMAKLYGGTQSYFPTLATATREDRDQQIRAEFRGDNVKELARKYRLGVKQIRRILGS